MMLCAVAGVVSCGRGGGEQPQQPDSLIVVNPDLPMPDPDSKLLYNGVVLPDIWPPRSAYQSNIYAGMQPDYLKNKPSVIDITIGRQLFVDDFLISSTSLERVWHRAEYHSGNPVLQPEAEWEFAGDNGGGFAAPFSDGVWFDESDSKFKMWYMGGGNTYGDGNAVTCYAESNNGTTWTRPQLNVVQGTNIVHRGKQRDSNSVWMDKRATNPSQRFKMFNVYGGAGAWAYHYFTSSDGKAWREQSASESVADRSTVFFNPFRGVWVFSMRHNVRVDASNLVRARDYSESADASQGTKAAKADLQKFWFGPWPDEPRHPSYQSQHPAIYNLDAIAYESVMLGLFSVWSGPENDVCSAQRVVKRNQILLGYSRDGWNWYRGDFTPFCATDDNPSAWNNGNIQSAVGSPIIVGDKLYFYMSGRHLNAQNAEITSTGVASLRRDGFASMSGRGELVTEPLKFTGEYLYLNACVRGTLHVELLDEGGNVVSGFSKDESVPFTGDATNVRMTWRNRSSLAELKGKTLRVKFYMTDGDLYAFWISQFEDGRSYGYTAGGGPGLSRYGMDI